MNLDDLLAQYSEFCCTVTFTRIENLYWHSDSFRWLGYFNEQTEKMRASINSWIRSSKEFDGVVDFDTIVRDPASPVRLKTEYDSGDHLHPSAAGYKAMADGIDLSLFR